MAETTDRALRALEGAREFLTPRGRWRQYEFFSGASDAEPACACILGALAYADAGDMRVVADFRYDFPGMSVLQRVLGTNEVADWNDVSSRRKGQVLKALDAAIALRKSQLATAEDYV